MPSLLSLIVFLPALGAIALAVVPAAQPKLVKQVAAAITLADLLLVLYLWIGFDTSSTAIQFAEHAPWVPALNIFYYIGVDGLSLPMVLLTALLGFLSVIISWGITLRPKALLCPAAATADRHLRRLHLSGLCALLPVLGSGAAAYVSSHLHLGQPAAAGSP